ncbi:hypothetical protein [Streptomyces sp. NBC_01237]|uniref:hypothetical protein n=1 Tax=Streptomyces sp. NBC_01237 TaxID=2903790 RepID=UPI002DDB12FB|nr:hypothetical protein [Streptomyces sp. NBC_01237]WRZ76612.1 hypothetical protein OG251_36115 [Streptomyces sp. NBC_01237]
MGRQPAPEPGDTARLDQLAAHWREAPPEIRQDILTAAAAVQDAPEPGRGRVAHLLEALGRLDLPDTPDGAP